MQHQSMFVLSCDDRGPYPKFHEVTIALWVNRGLIKFSKYMMYWLGWKQVAVKRCFQLMNEAIKGCALGQQGFI